MVEQMPAAVSRYRACLLFTSAAFYPLIFGVFLIAERPGLGLGHFYYIPVAMIALASGPYWGVAAGVVATGFYTLGILINPHIPVAEILTTGTSIRFVTFTTMGALVGWFAHSNRELECRLRHAEERDALTGLLNTRAFDIGLSARIASGRPFSLVLADIDGLKDLNEREGHAAGNDLLRHTATVLERLLAHSDQVARIGGDEFAVLTGTSGADDVRALCGRLSNALANEGLTLSFGWAICPRDGDSPLLLFRAADERLYAQKLIRSRLAAAEAEVVSLRPTGTRQLHRARNA